MKNIIDIVQTLGLLEMNQLQLIKLKEEKDEDFSKKDARIYRRSLYRKDEVLYFIGRTGTDKRLFLVSGRPIHSPFELSLAQVGEISVGSCGFSFDNAKKLWEIFPFTKPVSLRDRRTTIGCGDRLGLATAGHLRAIRPYAAAPVLAQQSIRELTLTGRTYPEVVSDVTFQVFQEGYEKGYGADGDHLKTLADIDVALAAGMPMITLDLSEVMNAQAASWSDEKIEAEFAKLPEAERTRYTTEYAGRSFTMGTHVIEISAPEAKRCALMYLAALNFARTVDLKLREKRGDQYDLEISIDETTAPTLPSHHLLIIRELLARDVHVNSLAPRFIGEFQKGIDYIGSIEEFEKQFVVHCAIASAHGNYKISIHSGSDKFSVYPVIGTYTQKRVHLKTAGTSWLEAVRTITRVNPALYRRMHRKAFGYLPEALKLYHITADFSKIPDIDSVPDSELGQFLVGIESRQLIHITYGGLLNDPEIRPEFFRTLAEHEDLHTKIVAAHIGKHISLLGIEYERPELQPNTPTP